VAFALDAVSSSFRFFSVIAVFCRFEMSLFAFVCRCVRSDLLECVAGVLSVVVLVVVLTVLILLVVYRYFFVSVASLALCASFVFVPRQALPLASPTARTSN